MVARFRTLAAATGLAALVGAVAVAASVERHLVRGESMKPELKPRDTVISIRTRSLVGLVRRPRVGDVAVIALPWEHDLLGVKRLVASPGQAWRDGDDSVAAGPGWVAVGDERTLSTDSRHHGRVPDDRIRAIVVGRVPPPESRTDS